MPSFQRPRFLQRPRSPSPSPPPFCPETGLRELQPYTRTPHNSEVGATAAQLSNAESLGRFAPRQGYRPSEDSHATIHDYVDEEGALTPKEERDILRRNMIQREMSNYMHSAFNPQTAMVRGCPVPTRHIKKKFGKHAIYRDLGIQSPLEMLRTRFWGERIVRPDTPTPRASQRGSVCSNFGGRPPSLKGMKGLGEIEEIPTFGYIERWIARLEKLKNDMERSKIHNICEKLICLIQKILWVFRGDVPPHLPTNFSQEY